VLQDNYPGNQDVLDLIEKFPDGVLFTLDDQIRVRNGSDATFFKKITETHAGNPRFKRSRRAGAGTGDMSFGTTALLLRVLRCCVSNAGGVACVVQPLSTTRGW
jgi:hypothetical protein